jgi:aryl-alcohol dehydrogenase-like predicted oxidoreductase
MGLSIAYGPGPSDPERQAILSQSIVFGSTFLDTANIYSDSEALIGAWLSANPPLRDKVFLATKLGLHFEDGQIRGGGDAAYVRECIDESFRRLKVDFIDLVYVHRIDTTIPIEETITAMKEYVAAGKVGYLGLSECSADTIRRAYAVHPIAAVQVEYSPFVLEIEDPENGVLKTCRELGIAIVAYSPLGRGLLTGTIKSRDDFAPSDSRRTTFVSIPVLSRKQRDTDVLRPRFSEENFPKNLVLVDQITELANKKGCTTSQLTLAWILKQRDDFFVIPGTKRSEILKVYF